MQNIKPVINSTIRGKLHRSWRLIVRYALITFVFSSVMALLASTSYLLGQFEFRESILILNQEGCAHLRRLGVTTLPQPERDTCRMQLVFRPNLLDGGGRIKIGGDSVRIPEHQLVASLPVSEQPWTAHQWFLVALEAICVLLVLLSVRLTVKYLQRENPLVTKTELHELAKAGRTAIEYRLLGVLMRPRAFTEADEREMAAINELIARYDELMAVCLERPDAVRIVDGEME